MTSTSNPGWYFLNLTLLLIAGVALSAWTFYFTDLFPVIGGLLGLGGVFAWIAFLSNIVGDDRKTQLQTTLDENVLQRPWAIVIPIAICLVFHFTVSARYATVLLDASLSGETQSISVGIDGQDVSGYRLAGGSTQKVLLPVNSTVTVAVAGHPSAKLQVAPLQRTSLMLPDALYTGPTLLIRPEAQHASAFFSRRMDIGLEERALRFLVGSTAQACIEYAGEAVWLGAEAGMRLPDTLADRWRFEFSTSNLPPRAEDVEDEAPMIAPSELIEFWHDQTLIKPSDLRDKVVQVQLFRNLTSCRAEQASADACWSEEMPESATYTTHLHELRISAAEGRDPCITP